MNAVESADVRPEAAERSGPQLRTILLTDLVDSTALVERLGDAAAAELFRAHDRLVLGLQQHWRGRLIDRSDGLLLLFERPIDGLGFALDYNRGLLELGSPHAVELKARAGLHVGEVLTWRNSDEAVRVGAKPLEVEGLAKPMAGRLMAMARPGQILLSAVAEPLAHRAARELGERGQHLLWKSHGRWRFKGVPEPQQVFEVGEAGIAPLRAPSSTAKAWRDVPLWRRPMALAAQVALLAVVAVGLWIISRPQPAIAFNERDWVVVADLRNLTGEPLLDDSLEQAFRISLEQSRYVNVLSDLKTRDTLARMQREPDTELDRAIASEIAIRDGARAVILPTVAEVGGRVRISAEVVDPNTQTTVYSEFADGTGTASALVLIDEVTAALRERLGEALHSIENDSIPLPQVTTADLNALRAYALAQQATADRRWEEAKRLYHTAVKLDPEFALAHMGLVRIYWSSIDYAAAKPHLQRALALRDSLPPRDRLYLDAWQAETASTGSPVEEWILLASMYPDYFAGASNASWNLLAENRFEEALPFAEAAAVPQDPLRAVPLDHIGRIQLATGDADAALETFQRSENESGGGPTRSRADALAALGRYDDAWTVLAQLESTPEDPSSLYAYISRISISLDQGRFDQAGAYARKAGEIAATVGGAMPEHFGILEQSVALARDPREVSFEALSQWAEIIQTKLSDPDAPDLRSHAFRLLVIAHIAQRSGHRALASTLIDRVEPEAERLQSTVLEKLLVITQATRKRLDGKPGEAIELLSAQLTGQELVQAHVALAAAYRDVGRDEDADAHLQWVIDHRGRAYAEINMEHLLQPLNVADARAAQQDGSPASATTSASVLTQAR